MKKHTQEAIIYTLSDENGNVFYVGCTTCPLEERLSRHLCDARGGRGNQLKNEMVIALDYKIFITPIQRVNTERITRYHALKLCRDVEMKWMVRFYKMGCKLTNGKELQTALLKHAA